MKKCKLIHINDGAAETLENGNFHFVEEFTWAEEYLNQYLRQGYEVRQMIPEVTPAIQRNGTYSFYKSGFTVYMEKEVADDDQTGGEEDAPDFYSAETESDWADFDDETLKDQFFAEDDD